MPAFDLDKLSAEISAENPAGEDLAYDAAYLELFRKAEGTPEQQMGDTIVPAEEPDWRTVQGLCVDLLGRTRDLRLLTLLCVAALKTGGLAGLRDGLAALRANPEKLWEPLFPRLDPGDNNDPLERMNIIAGLAAAPEAQGDPLRLIKHIRDVPLTNSRALGRFGLRSIALATGESQPKGEEARPERGVIDGAFDDTPVEELKASSEAVAGAVDHLRAIETFLDASVGVGKAPDLGTFERCLLDVQGALAKALARRGVAVEGASPDGSAGTASQASAGVSFPGAIRSHDDVLLALDRICQYYERTEPSSPVPLLLQRAKRLVSRSFVEILTDLSPDSMAQFKVIAGIQ